MVFAFLHFVFFQVHYIHFCWKHYVELRFIEAPFVPMLHMWSASLKSVWKIGLMNTVCDWFFVGVEIKCKWSFRKYLAQLLMHSSVWLKLIFAQLSLPPCNLGHKTILLQKVFFLFWFTKQTLSRLDLEPHFSVSSKCWQAICLHRYAIL